MHPNSNVRVLVTLEANLGPLTNEDLAKMREKHADGLWYYCVSGHVDATYRSASTQYVLVLEGKRYDTVTAEYV